MCLTWDGMCETQQPLKGMLCLASGLHTAQTEPVPPTHTPPFFSPPPGGDGGFSSLTLILRNIRNRQVERETACAVSPCAFAQLPIKGLLGEVYGVQTA